jgi:hypothetical protein
MAEAEIVAQFDWAAVKKRKKDGLVSYDVWQWNVYKMKWVRLANAGGFGFLRDAAKCAKELSDETEQMLHNNQTKPPAIT